MKAIEIDEALKLAQDHVEFLLELMRPFLIAEFEHGFKHGIEFEREKPGKERG